MKKVFKLISLFILLLILNVGVVRAEIKVNAFVGNPEKGIASDTKAEIGYFANQKISRFKLRLNDSNTGTDAYCHNPGIFPWDKNATGSVELKTLRTINNPMENVKLQNVYDAGLMYILQKKCDDNDNKCYVRNYIAINLYEQLFPTMNSNGSNTNAQIKYLKWIIKENFSNEIKISNSKTVTLEDELKTLNRLIGSKLSSVITSEPTKAEIKSCSGANCDSLGQVDDAVKLVAQALNEAISYAKKTQSDMPSISMSKGAQTKDSSGQKYSNTISHSIKIIKFGKDAVTTEDGKTIKPSAKLSFECKNAACEAVKNDIVFTLTGGSLKESKKFTFAQLNDLKKINLVSYTDKDGTGTFELKIKFTGNNCDDSIDYAVNLEYTQYVLTVSSGYSVSRCINSNACQGFYVNDSSTTSGTRTNTLENSMKICNNSKETTCTAKIDNVSCESCVSGRNLIEIKEGYDYKDSNSCSTSDGELNIQKCVANDGAKDGAGNSLKNTELSNKAGDYANVYCMENYKLDLPGSIVTAPFRSFTLNANVDGTQTCVTNKIDGIEDVIKKVETESINSINNYNEYSAYDTLIKCIEDGGSCLTKDNIIYEREKSERCGQFDELIEVTNQADCQWGINGIYECFKGDDGKIYRYGSKISQYRFKYNIQVRVKYDGYSDSCESSPDKEMILPNEPIEYWTSCSYTNPDLDPIDIIINEIQEFIKTRGQGSNIECTDVAGVKEGMDTKSCKVISEGFGLANTLTIGPADISTAVDDWNNATGFYSNSIGSIDDTADIKPFINGWKMNYNFDPTMKFWYQESYMQKARTNVMDRKLNIGNLSSQFCMGEVDPKTYECTTGWKDKPETTPVSACICSTSGCTSKKFNLSKVKYSKQSQTASATYVTPTQFYTINPSGSVVVAEPGQSSKITNSIEETNKLVVGQKSIGTFHYTLWLENLGDYFNKDSLGRIWGQSNSVVSELLNKRANCDADNDVSLVEKDKMSGASNGAYVCKYTTNCTFNCKNPEKYISKDENGKEVIYYGYCDYLPKSNENSPWQCRTIDDKITYDEYLADCDGGVNNSCEWNNGDPKCKDGNSCTDEEYYNECTSCSTDDGKPGPIIETVKDPNTKEDKKIYTYCDYLPYGSENATYQCKKEVDETQYNNDCNPQITTGNNSCQEPTITIDDDNKSWYAYKIGDQQYEHRTKTEYFKDCTSCYKDSDQNHPGPLTLPNGNFSFYNQDYDDGTDDLYENKTESDLKRICCPDCPTGFACAHVIENGKSIYFDNNGDEITGENENEIITKYNKLCSHSCDIITDEKGTTYYNKEGGIIGTITSKTTSDEKEKIIKEHTEKCLNCPDCPTTCEYCLYDGNKLNIQYRPVTSEDLNPNDRDLGVNWKVDEPIDTTMELKAYVTTNEIESDGDKIFDEEDDEKNNTFFMKVEMTPAMTSAIRNLNNSDDYKNGFSANTLACYDYDDGTNLYENIYCYSTFLDDLLDIYGKGSNPLITFANGIERPNKDNRETAKNADHEKYFTSFATKKLSDWNISTTKTLESNYNKYGMIIDENGNVTDYHVGPSWK